MTEQKYVRHFVFTVRIRAWTCRLQETWVRCKMCRADV